MDADQQYIVRRAISRAVNVHVSKVVIEQISSVRLGNLVCCISTHERMVILSSCQLKLIARIWRPSVCTVTSFLCRVLALSDNRNAIGVREW